MRVISIVGARPQFVKLAPISDALSSLGHDHFIVHTGQHYDDSMSDSFFRDLGIPSPDINLSVGSGPHGRQTGAMLSRIEEVLEEEPSDWVLVYGDTNSTLAGALAAAKMHRQLAHLEAGLRSHNRRMPEELNRIATDHLSDLLLAPSNIACDQLRSEGLADRMALTGDVMTDICLATKDRVALLEAYAEAPQDDFVVATIHRPDNTDNPEQLKKIITGLAEVPIQVLLVAHPRLEKQLSRLSIDPRDLGISVREPMAYPEMISTIIKSRGVITDSGGLQKEAYILNIPCTTLRQETEWTETLEGGWNILDPSAARLASLAVRARPIEPASLVYGDGRAAISAVEAMARTVAG